MKAAPMRIVAVTRVLNEADIVESFMRHTAAFVVHHMIMDNGSSDGTIQILNSLKDEGLPITVFQSRSVTFNESDTLTFLFKEACKVHKPDWILCIDADEFLDDRQISGGLQQYLDDEKKLKNPVDYIKIAMINYAATSKDNPEEAIVPLRIQNRMPEPNAYKVLVRGCVSADIATIAHGGHAVSYANFPGTFVVEPKLFMAHYSERSPYQYIVKFIRGWSKVLATGKGAAKSGAAYHYKEPYERLLNEPQSLLRNNHFMGFKNEQNYLINDPIDYRGSTLKYTQKNDEAMRAVSCLMGFLNDVVVRHGEILDKFPQAVEFVHELESKIDKVF